MMATLTEKKQTPMLFKPYMVNAVLAEMKLQTRRLNGLEYFNKNPDYWDFDGRVFRSRDGSIQTGFPHCPYGKPGDLIWVRETAMPDFPKEFSYYNWSWAEVPAEFRSHKYVIYKASWTGTDIKWHPSIHMPKWACRLWLEIRKIRIERLLDITDGDAVLEGTYIEVKERSWGAFSAGTRSIDGAELVLMPGVPRRDFINLFASINGQALVDANPWLWVISFEKVEAPQ